MATLIIFLLYAVVIIICILKCTKPIEYEDNITSEDYSPCCKVNGVNIHFTDEELTELNKSRAEQRRNEFIKERDKVISRIKADAEISKDIVRRKVLEEISKMTADNYIELEHIKFLYNNGNLRSNKEVSKKERYLAYTDKRKNYDKERHLINFMAFFIPFATVQSIVCVYLCKSTIFPLAFIIALIPAGIAAIIGMLVGYKININNAKEYGISENNTSVQEEKNKLKVGVAASVISGASMIHHTKKTVKGIADVDSWKDMK